MLNAPKAQDCALSMFEKGFALIVEDNPETLDWLASCVSKAFPGLIVRQAETFAGAVEAGNEQKFDLALIDLGLPDGNGLDLISELRRHNDDCHVIVATIYDDDAKLLNALRAGARGYILKDQDLNQIVSYLQGIKYQRPAISAASSQRLIDHFNSKGTQLKDSQLTPRETEVTRLIAKGYSIEETAGLLSLSPDTVKGYVKSIYGKLDVNNRSELTLAAVNLGLVDS